MQRDFKTSQGNANWRAMVEAGLATYDIQGPLGVVEAAGGVVTNWQGGPADQGGQVIAAANSELHAKALKVLADYA